MALPPVANHSPRRTHRLLTSLAILIAALSVAPSIASATPKPAPDTVQSVEKKLADLTKQNAQLIEKFDQAQTALDAAKRSAQAAARAAAAANAAFSAAQDSMSYAAAAQYEGGNFSSTGALLSSDSGQSYLDRLGALNMISSHFEQVTASYNADRVAATNAAKQARAAVSAQTQLTNSLAAQKKNVDAQILKYRVLLSTLTAAQQAQFQQNMAPTVTPALLDSALAALALKGASPKAEAAAQFALKQVGKPYVYGSAGPNTYDCSGLTMAAYASVGISLPHSAAEQDQYPGGQHIPGVAKYLRPGDLVFYYQPIGHVEIYIGNNLAVSAPEPGEDVKVTPINSWSTPVDAIRIAP